MAARLHYQDGLTGAETSDDAQGEHEAIAAPRGKHFLVPLSISFVSIDPIYSAFQSTLCLCV